MEQRANDNAGESEEEPSEGPRIPRRVPQASLLRDEAFLADEGSDSSEDERPSRNTVGNVPLEWYAQEEHIGYDRYTVSSTPDVIKLLALLTRLQLHAPHAGA